MIIVGIYYSNDLDIHNQVHVYSINNVELLDSGNVYVRLEGDKTLYNLYGYAEYVKPDLRDVSISHATLRNEDILPTFLNVLEKLDIDRKYKSVIEEGKEYIANNFESENGEMNEYICGDLFNALDSFSPDGYEFGPHIANATYIGWWKSVDDCDE